MLEGRVIAILGFIFGDFGCFFSNPSSKSSFFFFSIFGGLIFLLTTGVSMSKTFLISS